MAPAVSSRGFTSFLLGTLLVSAAALKAHQVATAGFAAIHSNLQPNIAPNIALIAWEAVLGLLLAANALPRVSWLAAVATFCCFGGVSLNAALHGATSCNCFGALSTNPRLIVIIDAIAVVALLWSAAGSHATSLLPVRFGRMWSVAFIGLAVAVVAWITIPKPTLLGNGWILPREGTPIVLLPEKWLGQEFPLLPSIPDGNQLATGKWIVVLYRQGCTACDTLLGAHRRGMISVGGKTNVAFVEVPSGEARRAVAPRLGAANLKLTGAYKWLVQTPVQIELADGIVGVVQHGVQPMHASVAPPGNSLVWKAPK